MNYKIVNVRKLATVAALDRVLDLAATAAPFAFPRRRELPSAPRTILAVRVAYIGDIIMTFPALAALRAQYPQARLCFLTSPAAAPLLEHDPTVDEVIPYEAPWFYPVSRGRALREYGALLAKLRSMRLDLAIDFRADIRNIALLLAASGAPHRLSYTSGGGARWLTVPVDWPRLGHKIEFHLDLLREAGIQAVSADPTIRLKESEIHQAEALLEAAGWHGRAPVILIHPGARLALKQWPVNKFAALARKLARRGFFVAVTGSHAERALTGELLSEATLPERVNFAGRLGIRQFAALASRARLLVGNDSAPIHLAAASGAGVVAIFGPSKPWETAPRGARCHVAYVPCDCRPDCDESACRRLDQICLEGVTEKLVEGALERALEAGRGDV